MNGGIVDMREIKFRAWNTEKKIMCYDNEDCEATFWDGAYASDVGMINARLNMPDCMRKYEYMQYIGKTDINKKEIYEGDIVKTNSGRLCKVIWFSSPQYQGWDLVPIETINPIPKEWRIWENLEVVGNIFDNPELLGSDDE